MSPDGGGEPEGELKAAIDDLWGSRRTQKGDQRRRRQALRQRLDVARLRRHRPRGPLDAEPGQPAPRERRAAARHRRVGARLLPQLPEPPPRLPGGLVERRQLGRGRAPLRSFGQASPVGHAGAPHRRHREARRRGCGALAQRGLAGGRRREPRRRPFPRRLREGARRASGRGARRPRRRHQRRLCGVRIEAVRGRVRGGCGRSARSNRERELLRHTVRCTHAARTSWARSDGGGRSRVSAVAVVRRPLRGKSSAGDADARARPSARARGEGLRRRSGSGRDRAGAGGPPHRRDGAGPARLAGRRGRGRSSISPTRNS